MKMEKKRKVLEKLFVVILCGIMLFELMPLKTAASGGTAITLIDIGNVCTILDPAADVVFTGEVNPNSICASQMELTQESWTCQDDDSSIGSTGYNPAGNKPKCGKVYSYSVLLTAKAGYYFSNNFQFIYGGSNTSAQFMILDDGKKIMIYGFIDPVTAGQAETQEISEIHIQNATLSFKPGDAPKFTGMVALTDTGKYMIEETWELWENGDVTEIANSNGTGNLTSFKEGKTYKYCIWLSASIGYTFAENAGLTVTLNGTPVQRTPDFRIPESNTTRMQYVGIVTLKPSASSTQTPTAAPTQEPTAAPTQAPTAAPTQTPGVQPTSKPAVWPFTDVSVNPGNWKYENIKFVKEKGVMTGVEPNEFRPDAPLTREMFASVVYRLAGSPDVTYKNIFSDVPAGKWYSNAIIWAYENGIVAGLGNGRYGTGENITREQLARMLMEYAKVQGYSTSERADFGKFADASQVSRWADENMRWAVGAGIISGSIKDGSYYMNPKGQATRAECAVMLTKFIKKY